MDIKNPSRHLNFCLALTLVVAGAAFVLSGCGGNDSVKSGDVAYTGKPGATTSVTFSDAAGAVPISTAPTKIGELVVAQADRTVYTFVGKDGKSIDCRAECAWKWLPVVVGVGVKVSGNAQKSQIGAVKYSKEADQVTYGGHPLYYNADDIGPGSTKGNGIESFGAKWYALMPDGKLAQSK